MQQADRLVEQGDPELYAHFSAQVSARYPGLDADEHKQRVRQFVAPPSSDARAPSPHLTGGAVDVTR